jgi:site-specific DNA recombinase
MATVVEVNRRGWHTKSWTNKQGRPVHGGAYDKTSLRALLRHPVYIGRMRLGEESFDAPHEPIVDTELWQAVQTQLTKHGRRGGGEAKNKYGFLLRGILACGMCGSSMTGTYSARNGRRWFFYVCSRVAKQGASACPGSRVSVGEMEPFVVEKIREIGRDPALVRDAITAAKAGREARVPELEAEARRLEIEKRTLVAERENLIAAVAGGGSGTAILVKRLGEVDADIGRLQEALADTRRTLVAIAAQVIDEAELKAALESFDPVWDELFPRERARILDLLIERIVYTRATGDVSITFRPSGIKNLGRRKESA